MDSIKTLAGWQAAVMMVALCISELTLTLNDKDMSALFILGTMFIIVAISALIAVFTKSKIALYIMTASLVAFGAFFFTFATSPTNIIVCLALAICFACAIDESNLMPSWVIILTIVEFFGILLQFRINDPVGFLIGTAGTITLVASSCFLDDKKSLKPKPASPA